jgi:hypothetical protein
MAGALKFNVFGKIMVAEHSTRGWQLFLVGAEGKRTSADVVIPEFIEEHELAQFLDDVFHESATLKHPSVIRIFD